MRGSIATPGAATVRYGGNTACVEIRSGGQRLILDAGSGLRNLGNALLAETGKFPLNLNLLITHTHWDHIQGLPFFAPVYDARCRVRILGGKGLRAALLNAMNIPFFPVPLKTLSRRVKVAELKKNDFTIGSLRILSQQANHPGVCLGYRILTPHGSVAYFPDNESCAGGKDWGLIEFLCGTDVLILDSQYSSAEYEGHAGWGHGCVDDSVALALAAGVKRLCLFHHDPERSDRQVDAMLRHARKLVARYKAKLQVVAAREGMVIQLGGKIKS